MGIRSERARNMRPHGTVKSVYDILLIAFYKQFYTKCYAHAHQILKPIHMTCTQLMFAAVVAVGKHRMRLNVLCLWYKHEILYIIPNILNHLNTNLYSWDTLLALAHSRQPHKYIQWSTNHPLGFISIDCVRVDFFFSLSFSVLCSGHCHCRYTFFSILFYSSVDFHCVTAIINPLFGG